MIIHTWPIHDAGVHIESILCDCKPTVEEFENGSKHVLHHAWDRREIVEEIETKLKANPPA